MQAGDAVTNGTGLAQAEPRPPLLPRYRRQYTFGGLLDETFRLFRQGWLAMLVVMAIAAVIRMTLTAVQGSLGAFTFPVPIAPTVPPGGRFVPFVGIPPSRVALFSGVVIASSIVSLVAILPSTIAIVRLTDGLMRGLQPS